MHLYMHADIGPPNRNPKPNPIPIVQ